MNIWLLFIYFQILDFLTTAIFLSMGVHELNPLINWWIKTFGTYGLLFGKLPVLVLLCVAYKTSRVRAVRWANCFYMALILWNVAAISMAPQLAL